MSIGANIKKARKQMGLTQAQLSDKCNMSRSYLCDIEAGRYNPSVETLRKIAKATNTTSGLLIGDASALEAIATANGQKEAMELLEKEKAKKTAKVVTPELGVPIGAITGIPIIASVKAGYDGLAIEDDTGEYVQIPSVMLRGFPENECRAMKVHGDSMYPNMKEGDIVVVHLQPEAENGRVAVCIVNGDEGTIKRFFRYSDRVELWPDNQQIPKMILRGEKLNSFHIYGEAIALIRENL